VIKLTATGIGGILLTVFAASTYSADPPTTVEIYPPGVETISSGEATISNTEELSVFNEDEV
jgi:hypothetical protein